jgi:hypothetical protein
MNSISHFPYSSQPRNVFCSSLELIPFAFASPKFSTRAFNLAYVSNISGPAIFIASRSPTPGSSCMKRRRVEAVESSPLRVALFDRLFYTYDFKHWNKSTHSEELCSFAFDAADTCVPFADDLQQLEHSDQRPARDGVPIACTAYLTQKSVDQLQEDCPLLSITVFLVFLIVEELLVFFIALEHSIPESS